MRVAALLDPEIAHPELAPEAIGPEEVRPPFVGRDDHVVRHFGGDPFALSPYARSVGPYGALVAIVEQLHPRSGAAIGQRFDVVHDGEKAVTRGAAVNRLGEGIFAGATGKAAELSAITSHGGANYRTKCSPSGGCLPRFASGGDLATQVHAVSDLRRAAHPAR